MTPLRSARRTDAEAWEIVVRYDRNIKKYAGLLFSLRPRQRKDINIDDAYQQARMAAFRAAQLFDETRGVSFMTPAGYWIRARLLRFFRQTGYKEAGRKPVEELELDYGPGRRAPQWVQNLLRETLIDPCRLVDDACQRERMERLRKVVHLLPERNWNIVYGKFIHGLTLGELSRRFGLCREAVRIITKKSLETLRKGMESQKPRLDFRHGRGSGRIAPCRERTSSSLSASA